jgi:hypothetical protein
MIMEDRLTDGFGVTRCTRVVNIGEIAAKGLLSASMSFPSPMRLLTQVRRRDLGPAASTGS